MSSVLTSPVCVEPFDPESILDPAERAAFEQGVADGWDDFYDALYAKSQIAADFDAEFGAGPSQSDGYRFVPEIPVVLPVTTPVRKLDVNVWRDVPGYSPEMFDEAA